LGMARSAAPRPRVPAVRDSVGFGIRKAERNGTGSFSVPRCRQKNTKFDLQLALQS
jgi:hypothetical protein